MDDTNKMILVPEKAYGTLLNQQQQLISPAISQLTNLDQQIQTVLANPNLPAFVKAAQYEQLARCYRIMHEREFKRPVPVTFQEQPIIQGEMFEQGNFTPQHEKTLLRSLPRNHHNKARLLLDHLRQHPDVFQLSDKNELVVNGDKVPGSNINDLVNEVVRQRAVRQFKGSELFADALASSNVPREALGSKERLAELQLADENFQTPQTPLGVLKKLSSEVSSMPRTATPSSSAKKKKKQAKKIARELGPSYEQSMLPAGQKRVPAVRGKGKSSAVWDQLESR